MEGGARSVTNNGFGGLIQERPESVGTPVFNDTSRVERAVGEFLLENECLTRVYRTGVYHAAQARGNRIARRRIHTVELALRQGRGGTEDTLCFWRQASGGEGTIMPVDAD